MKIGVIFFWSIFIGVAGFRVWSSYSSRPPDIGYCISQEVRGFGVIQDEPERKEAGQVFIVYVERLETIPEVIKLTKNKTNKNASGTVGSFDIVTSAAIASINNSVVAAATSSAGDSVVTEATSSIESSGEAMVTNTLSRVCSNGFLLRMKTKLYPGFKFNDEVVFSGKLSNPRNFGEPGGRTFDYVGYLAKDDVFYEIKSAEVRISQIDASTSNALSVFSLKDKITETLFSFRRSFSLHLAYSLGEPYAALAAGLVLGEKSAMGNSLVDDFRTVGLIHIVILSGYSVTLIGLYIRKALSFLPRNISIISAGIAIMLFCIMVGSGATVMRACFMAEVVLLSELIRRDYAIVRSLAFVMLIMIILSPRVLFDDVSFQISALATLGLILLSKPMKHVLRFIPDKFELRDIVTSTVSTQLFVSPFILYMIGQLSLVSVFANIVVLPLIPFTMLSVFLTGASGFISLGAARVAGWLAHLLLSYILLVVEFFARLSFASLYFPPFSVWWVWGFYVVAVSALVWWRRKNTANE